MNQPDASSEPVDGSPSFGAAQPITVQVVPERRPPKPRSSFGTWLVFGLVALSVVGPLLFLLVGGLAIGSALSGDYKVEEEYHSLNRGGQQKVAILAIEGTILETEEGFVKRQIDRIRDDEQVKAIVLRVDSPGGTVTASDYLYHHLKKLAAERKLPMVVSMGSLAASGGYYVAMAVGDTEQAIYAEPTTWTGSIGVVIPHYNVAGLMKSWQIEEDSVKSHPLKQMGSPTKQMTAEERAIFEGLVQDSFARFKSIVQSGRPKFRDDPSQLDAVATGQIFTTQQALAAGLVDKEGFVEDAIERAIALAGLDRNETRVVKYDDTPSLSSLLLGAQSQASRGTELQTLLDLSAPRAYFLCTWLPAAMASGR